MQLLKFFSEEVGSRLAGELFQFHQNRKRRRLFDDGADQEQKTCFCLVHATYGLMSFEGPAMRSSYHFRQSSPQTKSRPHATLSKKVWVRPAAKAWHVELWIWEPESLTSLGVTSYGSHLIFFKHPPSQAFLQSYPVPKMSSLWFFNRIALKPNHDNNHDSVEEATNWTLLTKDPWWFLLLFLARSLALGSVHLCTPLNMDVDVLTLSLL